MPRERMRPGAVQVVGARMPSNAFERTVKHRGPRLAAGQPSCLAAQLDR